MTVTETTTGKNIRLNIEIYKNEDRYQWALQSGGNYILRTNWKEEILKMLYLLKGRIEKKLTEDIRGTRYRIEGPAIDGRIIHVVCRFKEQGNQPNSAFTFALYGAISKSPDL